MRLRCLEPENCHPNNNTSTAWTPRIVKSWSYSPFRYAPWCCRDIGAPGAGHVDRGGALREQLTVRCLQLAPAVATVAAEAVLPPGLQAPEPTAETGIFTAVSHAGTCGQNERKHRYEDLVYVVGF